MAKREIGLMGYVGEAVVEQWLWWKYPEPEYDVVPQIIPVDNPATGGGYLDFGVIRDGGVVAVYEVKSQDYVPDKNFPINQALLRIWLPGEKPTRYRLQDGRVFPGDAETDAFLVVLAGPNADFIKRIGASRLDRILLFQDIWEELDGRFDIEQLHDVFIEDVGKVIEILRNPNQGKRTTSAFLSFRNTGNIS